jgi:hypothetical protein
MSLAVKKGQISLVLRRCLSTLCLAKKNCNISTRERQYVNTINGQVHGQICISMLGNKWDVCVCSAERGVDAASAIANTTKKPRIPNDWSEQLLVSLSCAEEGPKEASPYLSIFP